MSRIIPAVVGANTSGDSIETATLAIDKLFSAPTEKDNKPKAAATPAPTPAPAEEIEAPAAVEGEPAAEIETAAEPTPEPVQPRTLKVKLPEGEQELTEDEVIKGYLRQQDYTRKTQEAATLRKQDEAERTAVKAERLRYAEALTKLHDALADSTPQEPDWEILRATADPAEFAQAWSQWDAHKAHLKQVTEAQERALAAVHKDKLAEFEQHMASERDKLFEALPAWKDEKVRETERKAVGEYAIKTFGYTPDDLAQVNDHRVMLILHKAYRYDKGVTDAKTAASIAAGKVEPGRVIPPKGGVTPPKDTAKAKLADAKKRVGKSGSVDDAAAAIALLDD